MKVTVNSRTVFRFPTALILNGFVAYFVCKKLKKYGVNLRQKQALVLFKEMRNYGKKHKNWNLVEFYDKDGDIVITRI